MKLYDVIRKEAVDHGDTSLVSKDHPIIPVEPPKFKPARSSRRHRLRILIIGGVALIFLAVLYVLGMKFVHARITVTERRIPFTLVDAEFELTHEEDAGAGRLAFQTMVVETEVSRQVYGSDIQPTATRSTGKVVFFNEYSTKAQTVKKGTTITSKEGKKYQTQSAVTVPGYTIKSGKKTAGTSAAILVTAAAAGPTYDTKGTTFTVAGFGKTFYAQSAGAITGGEDGVMHMVSEADKPDVMATLNAQLIERLKRETRTQIPADLVAFPDMQFATIDSDSVKLRGPGIKFPATLKGSMVTYLISRDLLEQAIARSVSRDHTYPVVTIPTLEDLVVIPVSTIPADPKNVPEVVTVRINGTGTIITKAPLEAIRESLVGRPRRVFASVVNSIPEVDTAQYHLYPFWAPFFPAIERALTFETK